MIVGALTISNVHAMDTTADAFCPVDGCFGMALRRLEIAGHPAGFACAKHASEMARIWREIVEPAPVERMAA